MRHTFLLIMSFLASICFSQNPDSCNFQKSDAQLNVAYNKILKEYKSDTLFIKRLKNAQKAWIKFRDAHFESRFPSDSQNDKAAVYGSVYSVCACVELSKLTDDRTKQLQNWLNGTVEGDVCGGSYKTK